MSARHSAGRGQPVNPEDQRPMHIAEYSLPNWACALIVVVTCAVCVWLGVEQ